MKLNRTIETWDKCDAGAMSKMSEAAIKYAFEDAKQDIKQMAAIQAQLVAALKNARVYVSHEGDDEELGELDAAIAAAGTQP